VPEDIVDDAVAVVVHGVALLHRRFGVTVAVKNAILTTAEPFAAGPQ